MVDKRLNALIIDDEQPICDLLHTILTEQGYMCASVTSGKDALAKLDQNNFDLILLDLRIPDISGIDILKEIRSKHYDAVVIVISAIDDTVTAVEMMKLGALDYIVKPFSLAEVTSRISAALRSRETSSVEQASLMDAIASGVKARVDPFNAYSRVLTEETVNIAHQLGIEEKEIKRWLGAKSRQNSGWKQIIKAL